MSIALLRERLNQRTKVTEPIVQEPQVPIQKPVVETESTSSTGPTETKVTQFTFSKDSISSLIQLALDQKHTKRGPTPYVEAAQQKATGFTLKVTRVLDGLTKHVNSQDLLTAINELKSIRDAHEVKDENGVKKPIELNVEELSETTILMLDLASQSYNVHLQNKSDKGLKQHEKKLTEWQKLPGEIFTKIIGKDKNSRECRFKMINDVEVREPHFVSDSFSKLDEFTKYERLLSRMKARIGSETSIILTAFINIIIEQIVHKSITNCVSSGKTTVDIIHLLSDYSGIQLMPLVLQLPVHIDAVQQFKTDSKSKIHVVKAASQTQPKDPFLHYVNLIIKHADHSMHNGDTEKPLKISSTQQYKEYLCNIIHQLIQRFGEMLKYKISEYDVKTVENKHIRDAIQDVLNFHAISGVTDIMESLCGKFELKMDEKGKEEWVLCEKGEGAVQKYEEFRKQQAKERLNKSKAIMNGDEQHSDHSDEETEE
jgi:hypothetical protein